MYWEMVVESQMLVEGVGTHLMVMFTCIPCMTVHGYVVKSAN